MILRNDGKKYKNMKIDIQKCIIILLIKQSQKCRFINENAQKIIRSKKRRIFGKSLINETLS